MQIIWDHTLNAEDLKYYASSLCFRDINYLNSTSVLNLLVFV